MSEVRRGTGLNDLSTEELRGLWEKADQTPGQTAGGFTQGEIWQELNRRFDGSKLTPEEAKQLGRIRRGIIRLGREAGTSRR